MRALMLCAALSLLLPLFAAASKPFEPIPPKEKDIWRFDLRKNFYADEAAWKAECERFLALTAKVEAYKGKVIESPEYLLDVMNAQREAVDVLYRLYAYGEFREAIDTKDRVPYETYERLKAEADARTSFVKVELKSLDAKVLSAFLNQEPALVKYQFLLGDAMRRAPHTLSAREESALSTLGPDLTSWQQALFYKTMGRTQFPTIRADGKVWDVRRDFDALMQSPDRSVREKAFRDYYASLNSIQDLVGFGLLQLIRASNTEAKMRGFDNRYNESLFDRYLSRAQVDGLYAQMEARLSLYQDYQRFRMEEVRRELKVPQAEIWDMERPAPGAELPRYTASGGTRLVLDALSVLGPECRAELGKLLDPANGRMDIVGGPGRMQGAFCEANFGFFMDSYEGYLGNVSTLAHEAGHALHAQLVLNHRGGQIFHEGPGYMTESFAMMNEWLLRDHLLKTIRDEGVKEAIRRDALNEMMYLWELARRAKFEMVSYDRVASGQITDETGFAQACLDTGQPYDVFFDRYPKMLSVHWMRKQHYFTNPTYYLNYVIAHLLALKYYQLYLDDPKGFPARYTAMVAAGFEKPPVALLKDHLGIDFGDPKLLEGTFALIQSRFDEVKSKS
jgi:oligoendopeptidase F